MVQNLNLKYKNYIFDLGQVIVRFDTSLMTRVYIKDEEDAALAEKVIFDRIYWDKLDEGTISDDEVKSQIKSRLPKRLWENAEAVYDNWYKNMPFTEGVCELIEEIHKSDGKLFLLSNVSRGFAENFSSVERFDNLFSKFDGLVFSGVINKVKPNKEIFEYLLNKYSLKAEESFFIDDSIINVEGARSVGLNTYLFGGDIEDLRKTIHN